MDIIKKLIEKCSSVSKESSSSSSTNSDNTNTLLVESEDTLNIDEVNTTASTSTESSTNKEEGTFTIIFYVINDRSNIFNINVLNIMNL